jgi:RHS repeat-associated protein
MIARRLRALHRLAIFVVTLMGALDVGAASTDTTSATRAPEVPDAPRAELADASSAVTSAATAGAPESGGMAFGTGGASFTAAPTGAATYRIPIAVPPGPAGMQPNLALVYNSQGPSGLLGPGWAIDGLSAIARCPATVAQDGFSGGITFGAHDRFCLSGQRLMVIGGTYGADGAEYRTEIDSFVRVVSYGSAGTGPAFFRAWTKAGHVMEFGATADSRIEAQGKTSALLWALNKTQDPSGNVLSVAYHEDTAHGEFRPVRIDYGGNAGAGLAPTRSVAFEYEARPDVEPKYIAGSMVRLTARLSRIKTFVGTALARDYRLAYDNGGAHGRSRLVSVTECGSDGGCLPATTLGWQAPSAGALTTAWSGALPLNAGFADSLAGDVDGDGRADIVQVRKAVHSARTLRSNGNGTFTTVWTSPTALNASGYVWSTATARTLLADVNGDGRADIVQVRTDIHQGRVLLGAGDGSFMTAWTSPSTGIGLWGPATQTLVGDVNGDGRADIVQIRTDVHTARVWLSVGDGSFTPAWTSPANGTVIWGPSTRSFLRDVNGDGRADLVQIRTDVHVGRVALSNGDGSFTVAWTSPSTGIGLWGPATQTVVEDVNGDGLADIVQIRTDVHSGRVWLSTGHGAFTLAWTSPSNVSIVWGPATQTFVRDVDGDGLADIVQVRTDVHAGRVALSKGDGSFVVGWTSPSAGDGLVWGPATQTIVEDFDGDGLADIVQNRADVNAAKTLRSRGPVPDLATAIAAPLGGVTSIAYKPATDPTVHARENGPGYPVVSRPIPLPVVATTSTRDGRGGISTLAHTYGGLQLHLLGRGGLGFRWRRVVEVAGGARATTFFHQGFPLTGLVQSSEVRDGAGALFLQNSNHWSPVNTHPGTVFVRLDQADTLECDGQPTCRGLSKSFEYDAHGNPTRTLHWGDVAVADQERDEYTEWAVDLAAWLHRPKRVVVYGPGAELLRERWTSYDGLSWGALGARGLPTREESRLTGGLGAPGNPVVRRAYDGLGNLVSLTDPRGCTTTTTFEATHRTYPLAVSTCLGHATTFVHDPRWGHRLNDTDPNGQTTSYAYDGLGRLTRVTGPLDGGSTHGTLTKAYLDVGNPSTQRVLTSRTEQHGTAAAIWAEEYVDGLGRVHLTRTEGPNGQTIQTETSYDARGLVAATSTPHFSTETPAWTQFTHDALRRRTRVTRPDGSSGTMAYSPGLVAVTDERGQVKRRHLDGFGRVTRVEEVTETGTFATRYSYDATGALRLVTNHLGHETRVEYDHLGRKVSLTDPSMGTWTYGYDAGGLLTRQTDAKGQTLTFEHDAQGRVRFKRYPDGARIEWVYDDPIVAYSRGRLTRVLDLATATTFRYDALGRVTQTQRLLDGVIYTLTRAHDALGRVTTETFPDGDVVTYGFNTAGWLDRVGNGSDPVAYVASIDYNARGARTHVRYANGVTSTLAYFDGAGDSRSFRLKSVVTGGPTGPLQSLAYRYDSVGNIVQITDAIGTASRTFAYDALRRLTAATGSFGPSQASLAESYTYDAIGNLLTKGGVSYTYSDPLHPSAVTARSDGKSYLYDDNGNIESGAGRAMAWDVDNRLSAVTSQGGNSAEFAYDQAGHRVRKTVNAGAVTRYPFPGYEIDPSGMITKLFAGVARTSNGRSLFYHYDHLGGVHVVTDQTAARVQLVEYTPWGEIARSEGVADLTHRFTGQLLDPETGLLYYGGRYYDPLLARFVSPDPFVPEPGNPQALNRYSYVVNNPVNAIDPSGYDFWDDLADFFEDLGRSLAKNAPAIIAGIAVGVVAVATGGFGLGLAGPALAIFAGAAGGVAAGAVGTAINGGDLATNILLGAAFGAIGGAIAPGLSELLGGGFTGAVGTGAVLGGGFGGVSAAMNGGNVLEGIATGALSGALVSAAVYGGYRLMQPDESDGCMCSPRRSGEKAAIRPFGREVLPGVYHKGYAEITSDGMWFYEMGPANNRLGGPIKVFQSADPHSDLIPKTMTAFKEGKIVWGEWSVVERSALTAAQSAYKATYVNHPYFPFSHNSNFYVDFVFSRVGGNPHLLLPSPYNPNLFAPSFP